MEFLSQYPVRNVDETDGRFSPVSSPGHFKKCENVSKVTRDSGISHLRGSYPSSYGSILRDVVDGESSADGR